MEAEARERPEDLVLALVGELCGVPPAVPVGPGTALAEIGFDSLLYAEFAAAAEQRLGIALPDDAVRDLRTVGDVVALAASAPVSGASGAAAGLPRSLGRIQRPAGAIGGALLRRWFRLEVRGAERMPRRGPVVLCMNHESLLDIPLAVLASPRPIMFMAKRELFGNRMGSRLLHHLGAFPVDRDAFDLGAIRTALAVVARRDVLGMYPEGTRRPGVLLPFLPGAAWVALHAGAPLLPAAIRGTEAAMPPGRKVPRRVPVTITFDRPIEVAAVHDPVRRWAEAEELTARLRDVFERLLA